MPPRDPPIKLYGRYSVQRMLSLHDYSQRASYGSVAMALLLTPLPCLVAVALADSIPLEPVESGLARSQFLWVRYVFAVWIYSMCALEQLRHFIPELPLRAHHRLTISLTVSVISITITYGLTRVIGFPMPFTIQITCIPWGIILTSSTWFFLRPFIRKTPAVAPKLIQFMMVMSCEISLALVYPAYNAIFVMLSGEKQAAFTVIFPVIKWIEKRMISRVLRDVDDLKPEIIVFNVEVSSSLFVAFCMQNSKSMSTYLVLIALDFVQMCYGLWMLGKMLQENDALSKRLGLHQDEMIQAALRIAQAYPSGEQLIELEEMLERQRRSEKWSDRWSSIGVSRILSSFNTQNKQSTSIVPISISTKPSSHELKKSVSPTFNVTAGPVFQVARIAPSAEALGEKERPHYPVQSLTEREQRRYLLKILQLLHRVERLLLIEFVEVMIPIVYSVYLTLVFSTPNRTFYPQLKDMDEQRQRSAILSIMANASMELISLVLLGIVLWKKLRISVVKHIAFVLTSHWRDIQSKVILWVVVSVQCSLVHLGADYTFQFKWLHPET